MKIQRPGHTESNLLFQNFLKHEYPEQYNQHIEYVFIEWLYTTTGFYDKSVALPQLFNNKIPNVKIFNT